MTRRVAPATDRLLARLASRLERAAAGLHARAGTRRDAEARADAGTPTDPEVAAASATGATGSGPPEAWLALLRQRAPHLLDGGMRTYETPGRPRAAEPPTASGPPPPGAAGSWPDSASPASRSPVGWPPTAGVPHGGGQPDAPGSWSPPAGFDRPDPPPPSPAPDGRPPQAPPTRVAGVGWTDVTRQPPAIEFPPPASTAGHPQAAHPPASPSHPPPPRVDGAAADPPAAGRTHDDAAARPPATNHSPAAWTQPQSAPAPVDAAPGEDDRRRRLAGSAGSAGPQGGPGGVTPGEVASHGAPSPGEPAARGPGAGIAGQPAHADPHPRGGRPNGAHSQPPPPGAQPAPGQPGQPPQPAGTPNPPPPPSHPVAPQPGAPAHQQAPPAHERVATSLQTPRDAADMWPELPASPLTAEPPRLDDAAHLAKLQREQEGA